MAFGFFGRRKKMDQDSDHGATPQGHTDVPDETPEATDTPDIQENFEGNGRTIGDPVEQRVEWDSAGRLTPADFLPDVDLPQLNRSRANMLRRELEYRFAQQDAHIDIDGHSAMIQRADGGAAHVSLRTLAMNAAGLDNFDQLPQLVESFVHGTLADATLNDLSTADLYKSLRLRLLPTPAEGDDLVEHSHDVHDVEGQIREDSILRPFTPDMSIALVLDTEHAIRIQPLHELERFDELSALERAADRNTWQELVDASVDATFVNAENDAEGSSFWAFESTSYYLGSAPLFLSEMLTRWAPDLDQSDGVIFAVPDRDLLIARPVTTGEDLMNGITAMVRIAMRFGLGNPTSISPRLHLLRDSQVTTFTDYRVIAPDVDTEWSEQSFDAPPPGAIGIEVRPDAYLMERLQQGGFGDFGDFGEEPREID
ncbi:hypothetical protein CDES_04910 [Corynebacterium deserti GIMN1.010]|uniref:Uncharacterized protein n=1 Tax=Corynebacterium deserti GIMN1.010 TaxID=931089 RepID=A0A0M5IFY5_9CORY|nr:hypothetical protein [Corynebacterium deserti]ALC05424.1 hypothetical protein CDES_04910 [Corynebacterium deserti GIMN1.010]